MPIAYHTRVIVSIFFFAILSFLVPNEATPMVAQENLTITTLAFTWHEGFLPACVSVTEDGRTIAFQSNHTDGFGKSDIWLTRLENGQWIEPANAGPGINTSSSEYDGKLSPDGSTIVFIRSDTNLKPSIYISYFREGAWTRAEAIGPPVSTPETTEYGAVLSTDGRRLYFSSDRPGGYGTQDVYYSERIENGWDEPVNLGPVINSAEAEVDAAVSPNGRVMVLALKRPDSIDQSMDLYVSRRIEESWTPWANLGPRINTPGKDACPWFGYDGKTLYFNSTWERLVAGRNRSDLRWGWVQAIRSSQGF